jgi:AcrR family transcriptional regulator
LEDTKTKIFNAALELFAENSFHGASVRDIAKKIGKRESSIYNHFTSKEEILKAIIADFSSRNFGKIILTDSLINLISKPQKFFTALGSNLIEFWDSEKERMFIKVLLCSNNFNAQEHQYSINYYLSDFRKMTEIIFNEMIKHKFIKKSDPSLLSTEFISPLFLIFVESMLDTEQLKNRENRVKSHVDFFWGAIKR